MKVSIIVICEGWNHFLEEALLKYERLDYDDFTLYIFTTEDIRDRGKVYLKGTSIASKTKFISDPSTKYKPAEKRDLALKYAKGDLFAFIDEDAYPSKDWLKRATSFFKDKTVSAVGGPGVTPDNAPVMEKASGWVSASPLGGFGATHRFIPQKGRELDDFPSMNLIVRAKDFRKVGGFDSNYYPGEDTKLCLDLTKKLGKKIVYSPEVLVFHHKRPLFIKHLRQNGRFGFHRGHFARILPKTSRKWFYFTPSIFTLGFLGGLPLFLFTRVYPLPYLLSFYTATILIYSVLLVLNAFWILFKSGSVSIAFLAIPGVFLTHIWYGMQFIRGFLSKKTYDLYGRV